MMGFSALKEEFPAKKGGRGRDLSPATIEARAMLHKALETGDAMVYDTPSSNVVNDENRLRKEGTNMGLSVQVRALKDGRLAVRVSRKPTAKAPDVEFTSNV
jgi:hypothetical protein